MEETVYGIQAIRRSLPSLVQALDDQGGPRTIQFWKSWPDGTRCLMLELRPDEVPSRSPKPSGSENWYAVQRYTRGWRKITPHCVFDQDRDWWVAPADIDSIELWVSSRTDPKFLMVTPRRGL